VVVAVSGVVSMPRIRPTVSRTMIRLLTVGGLALATWLLSTLLSSAASAEEAYPCPVAGESGTVQPDTPAAGSLGLAIPRLTSDPAATCAAESGSTLMPPRPGEPTSRVSAGGQGSSEPSAPAPRQRPSGQAPADEPSGGLLGLLGGTVNGLLGTVGGTVEGAVGAVAHPVLGSVGLGENERTGRLPDLGGLLPGVITQPQPPGPVPAPVARPPAHHPAPAPRPARTPRHEVPVTETGSTAHRSLAPATGGPSRDSAAGMSSPSGKGAGGAPAPYAPSAPACPGSGATTGHDSGGGMRQLLAVAAPVVTPAQLRLLGIGRGHRADGTGRNAALPTTSPD
jgi:hypothetical protein